MTEVGLKHVFSRPQVTKVGFKGVFSDEQVSVAGTKRFLYGHKLSGHPIKYVLTGCQENNIGTKQIFAEEEALNRFIPQ